jgi:hypothetical protein
MVAACRDVDSISRAQCRDDVEQRFSQRAMALGYLDVYRSACQSERHCPPRISV